MFWQTPPTVNHGVSILHLLYTFAVGPKHTFLTVCCCMVIKAAPTPTLRTGLGQSQLEFIWLCNPVTCTYPVIAEHWQYMSSKNLVPCRLREPTVKVQATSKMLR